MCHGRKPRSLEVIVSLEKDRISGRMNMVHPTTGFRGFKFPKASTPVPPDGTTTAKSDCDLMWLGGYKADTHDLYFGTSAEEVASAAKDDLAFRKTFRGSANIFDPGELKRGRTYFWRIDAIRDGKTIKGETWKFTVEKIDSFV